MTKWVGQLWLRGFLWMSLGSPLPFLPIHSHIRRDSPGQSPKQRHSPRQSPGESPLFKTKLYKPEGKENFKFPPRLGTALSQEEADIESGVYVPTQVSNLFSTSTYCIISPLRPTAKKLCSDDQWISLHARPHLSLQGSQLSHIAWDTRISHTTHTHTHCIILLTHYAWVCCAR